VKNSAYWKQRFEQLEAAANKNAISTFETIQEQYIAAKKELEHQISAWYQRFAANNQISLADAKKLLNSKELAEFKWDVKEFIKYAEENALNQAWMKELENASAKFHISRLEALQIEIQQTIEKLFGRQTDEIDKLLKKNYLQNYYHTIYEIQKGFNIGWDIAAIDSRTIKTLISKPWATDGKNFSDRIWANKAALIDEVQKQLTRTMMLGKSPDDAIEAIATKMQSSQQQAGRLVMTESAYFASQSQKDAFNALDVEKFEIVATLDSRTSEICRQLDGHVFDMKDFEPGVTAPPFHPWCRTTTVPYFDDNFTERAARGVDGKVYYVPSDMKYADWKKTFVDSGSKEGLQQATGSSKIKLSININSEIYKKLGEEHYNALHDILNEAPEKQKAVWQKFENDLTVKSATSKVHPCCHNVQGIEMDVANDAKGTSYSKPYQITFHEFGHNIDYIANKKFGDGLLIRPFSFTYQDNKFGKTIEKEINDRVDGLAAKMKADFKEHEDDFEWLHENGYISDWNYDFFKKYGSWVGGKPKFSKSMAYNAIEKEVKAMTMVENADLSDILEGATKGKIQCGFGHGKSYWSQAEHKLSTEAFAEMFDSSIANIVQFEAIKKYFPESCKIFEEILDAILKG
jgi:SPP1 gp7 family putative phage head morphogenesis protein